MAQDIEVVVTHAITTQLDIPAEVQVRSIKIGEQQFYAQPLVAGLLQKKDG